MRPIGLWATFCVFGALLGAYVASAQTTQNIWLEDLNTARRIAAETNRLVLIHFWAEWCRPCRQMEAEVFSRPEVLSAIARSYVAVKLNFDQNMMLARQFNVESIPTDIVITPQGEVLAKSVGGVSAPRYVERLTQIATGWQQRQAIVGRMGTPPYGFSSTDGAAPYNAQSLPVRPPVASLGPSWSSSSSAGMQSGPGFGAPSNSAGFFPADGNPLQMEEPAGASSPVAVGSAPPSYASPGAMAASPGVGGGSPGVLSPGPYSPPSSPWGITSPITPSMPNSAAGPSGAPLAYAPQPAPDATSAGQQVPPGSAASPGWATPAPSWQQPSSDPVGNLTTGRGLAQQTVPGPVSAQPGAMNPVGAQPGFSSLAERPMDNGATQTQMAEDASQAPTSSFGLSGEPASSPVAIPPGNPPLALEGYCPVSLTDKHRWVLGNRRWGARHEGRTYLFAGPEEQQKFLANPDRYAPVLSGFDVVKIVERTELVEGRREHGAWFGGRVYLFSDEDSFQKFSADPYRYINALPQAVTQISQKMNAAGSASAAVGPHSQLQPGQGSFPDDRQPAVMTGASQPEARPSVPQASPPGVSGVMPNGSASPVGPSSGARSFTAPAIGLSANTSQPGPQIQVGIPERALNSLPNRVLGPSNPGYSSMATRPDGFLQASPPNFRQPNFSGRY